MNVVIVLPFYRDKRKSRYKELLTCLRRNLSNKAVWRVVAVTDTEVKLPHHQKLTIVNIGRRQTYDDLFGIAHSMNPDEINIVCNADIFFKEEDIKKILTVDFTDTVLALSRWDVGKSGKSVLYGHKDSQDAWIFKGKMSANGDFQLGRAGCDNVIAHSLNQNYNVLNPSGSIKSHHLHLTGIRNYKAKDAYQPPYYRVPICYHSDKPIKRVLHVGMNPNGQQELGNMLASFGEYKMFEWQKILKDYGIHVMRDRLIRLSQQFKPDLTFMQIQTPDVINAPTASQLHGFTLNWTGDCRSEVPRWMKDLAPYVDATCFSNETDVRVMREEGFSSWFLQIGFENKIFNPEGPLLATKKTVWDYPDIVFMANHYQGRFPLSQERYDIVHKLKKTYHEKALICGNGWDVPAINLMGRQKDEAMVYRSCKIAINANHFIHERFSSDRIFRIMGSGAFCLTRWYPGVEKDFIDGVNIRVFRNLDEMMYLIAYYLEHDDERQVIAEAGCELVHKKFTWEANKRLIKQIYSFPQEKMKIKERIITAPMDNKEWVEYMKQA